MKSVAIFAKPRTEHIAEIGSRLMDWLNARGIDVYLGELTASQIDRKPRDIITTEIPETVDLIIVLGGDGTILRVSRLLKTEKRIPIMAVNLGGLGFLASFSYEELYPRLQKILAGEFTVSRRSMLHVRHFHKDELLHEFTPLNEVVVKKGILARIIRLKTSVDREYITTYVADGLIISTPTGSTGYSMSAGGPIICAHMDALVLTPICPHTFTHRPVVIGADQVVEVVLVSSDSEVFLSIDGQEGFPMSFKDKIVVRRSPHDTHLIQNPKQTYFRILRRKLKWGQR